MVVVRLHLKHVKHHHTDLREKLIDKIRTVESMVYRYPLETVVQTSFGIMNDRPMVLVKLVDEDGLVGVGEVWCNFPAVGAEHRARLIDSVFEPLLTAVSFDDPIAAFEILTKKTWVLGLQTEFGPIAQCIAGIDIIFMTFTRDGIIRPFGNLLVA